MPLLERDIFLKSWQFSIPLRLKSDEEPFKKISFNFNEFFKPLMFFNSPHSLACIKYKFSALTRLSRFCNGLFETQTP